MDVTREQLARALATTRFGIEQAEEWKFGPTALPSRPDDLARVLLAKIGADPDAVAGMRVTESRLASALVNFRLPVFYHGEILHGASVHDPEAVATELYGALARIAALREPGAGVVEAHVCCEHADTDPELTAMAALLPAVPLLQRLSYDARVRVIGWYGRRVNDGQAPF